MPMIYPDVPNTPGVPPVNRNSTNQGETTQAKASGDSPAVVSASAATSQWGLFDSSGVNVLNPDSVFALDDFMHEFRLSTFPVEEGSFGTYNKVATPFEGRFIMNKGGSLSDRTTFLETLEKIVADTNLYVLATPELSYPNVNMPRYRLRRRSDAGFQLISVEVSLQEIRVAAAPAFSTTQDPTAKAPVTTGAVQSVTPTGAQVAQAQTSISPQGVGTLVQGQPAPPAGS
jgi:hypothetical protein